MNGQASKKYPTRWDDEVLFPRPDDYCGVGHRDLKVFDATARAADQVNALIDKPKGRRLLHVWQMRDSVQSIAANLAEGFGRGEGRDRARFLRIARGEAEETIRHLNANFRAQRIAAGDYWPIHNLLVVIVRMLTSLSRL